MKQLLILPLLIFGLVYGQTTRLTLDECYEKARIANPLSQQRDLLKKTTELQLENLDKNFLPKLDLNAQFSWQSEVTKFPLELPGMDVPSPPRERISATVDVKQLIYDGKATKAMKLGRQSELMVRQQEVEVDLYQLYGRVNELYLNTLLLQENAELIGLIRQDIESKLSQTEAAIRNGLVLESNADILKAELLKLDQQEVELESGKYALLQMLGELMDENLAPQTELVTPIATEPEPVSTLNRPELELLQYSKLELESRKELLDAQRKPVVAGFAQTGAGRPGLNFLDDSFRPIFIAGVNMSWNIWDWKVSENQKKIIDINKEIIANQQKNFELNIRVAMTKETAEMEKITKLMAKDQEIIDMRRRISESASKQLENGLINATQYLTELNAENQAKLMLKTHELQLIMARINYQTLSGNR